MRECTKEENLCKSYFVNIFRRNKDGRFIVRLPKQESVILGESKEQAKRRLIGNSELKQVYKKFLRNYKEQGYTSSIAEEQKDPSEEVYYLPHQPVVKIDSITIKLRVVFDASAKTLQGTSLNDRLLAGSNLQANLWGIILRFGIHEYVLTVDVAMMFREILVDERDRDLQRILWKVDPR